MKLSVSLTDGDIAFLDAYARAHAVGSRSGVLHEALALLREQELAIAYTAAWDEWASDAGNQAWDAAGADGLDATG